MKELLYPYIFICWLLLKTGIVKKTATSLTTMAIIGILMNVAVFFGHRFYSPVDLTDSSVVRAQSAILSPVTESIDKYYVDHNERVTEGQLLYTLVDDEQKNTIDQLEADIGSKTVQYEQSKADLERLLQLKSSVAERDIDTLRSQMEGLSYDIKSLEAKLAQAKYELSLLEIRAPFDGAITRLDTAEGSRVGNLQIWSTKDKILEMRIPDQLWNRVKPGQFAEFYVDAYPGHIFRGRVHSTTLATGEARGSHLSQEPGVAQQLMNNSNNLGRTVLIEFTVTRRAFAR